jgi:hypothetical protein
LGYGEGVFGPILKGVGLAASPAGRRVIRQAVKFARSDEGRKVVAQVKKAAGSPEARKVASQAGQAARRVGEAAKKPENQHRVKAAAKLLRRRAGG